MDFPGFAGDFPTDVDAERAVLAGIAAHGGDAFVDVDGIVDVDCFSRSTNQSLYRCFQEFYREGVERKIDVPSIKSVARKLGLQEEFDSKYIKAILTYPVELTTISREAVKLFNLRIAKDLQLRVAEVSNTLCGITGDESLGEILALAENPIFDFMSQINGADKDCIHIADGGEEWLEYAIANPSDTVGIPSPFAKYNALIGGGFRRGTVTIIGARRKTGKAGTLDSQVFTPMGPIRMGDVSPGNIVSTPDGRISRVVSIHPQGVVPIYRVVFADGDSAQCTLDHLWEVRHARKPNYEVMSLEEIVAKGLTQDSKDFKWQVRLPSYCHYDSQPIPMDPYLLGVLIGKGSFDHSDLKEVGLLGHDSRTKFVPEIYKYNSLEVRMDILQGLCDTDGSADKSGYCIEYWTLSTRLAADVKEMVQSIGGICVVKHRKTLRQAGESWSYELRIKHDDLRRFFRISRKQDQINARKRPPLHRTIKRVEYVGRKPAQCIMLEDPKGLYMTDHHIVTHNTIFCDNVCLHVAGQLKIPVLNIDTEMSQTEHLARILAHVTNINSNKIELGKLTPEEADRTREAMGWLKTIPYYYQCVIGKSFEEQVAAMRRWAVKTVGVDEQGVRKDSLIVYDYLQMTNQNEFKSDQFQEYQLLAFHMVALHAMAARCDVPVMSMVQLNRQGGIASSDRVTWKASSYSTLARKEEDADDAAEYPLRLNVEAARHGPGNMAGDYVNMRFDGATSRMAEGPSRYELERSRSRGKNGVAKLEVDIAEDEQFVL